MPNKFSPRDDWWTKLPIDSLIVFSVAFVMFLCVTVYIIARFRTRKVPLDTLCTCYLFCIFVFYLCTVTPPDIFFIALFLNGVIHVLTASIVWQAEPRM